MAGDSQTTRAAMQFLSTNETLIGAFVGASGPKPGVEAFAVAAFGLVLILTSSMIAWIVGIAVFAGVWISRQHEVIAVTSEGIIVIECGRRRLPREGARVSRLGSSKGLLFAEAGDPFVTLDRRKLWVRGADQDEARRLARLAT